VALYFAVIYMFNYLSAFAITAVIRVVG